MSGFVFKFGYYTLFIFRKFDRSEYINTQDSTNYIPNTVVFEIGNEVDHQIAHCATAGLSNCPTPTTYAADVVAFHDAIMTVPTPYTVKYAASGSENVAGNSWYSLNPNYYDFAVVHDYGWVPSMNDNNGYPYDKQATVTATKIDKFFTDTNIGKPVALTEMGSPDTFTKNPPPSGPTVVDAVTNEAIQMGIYASAYLLHPNNLTAAIKWPTKPGDSVNWFRSWEPAASGDSTDKPVYMLYQMLAPLYKGVATADPINQFGGNSALYSYTIGDGTSRYLVLTHVGNDKKRIQLTMPTGLTSVQLEAIQPENPLDTTHIAACSLSLSGGVASFTIPSHTVIRMTY